MEIPDQLDNPDNVAAYFTTNDPSSNIALKQDELSETQTHEKPSHDDDDDSHSSSNRQNTSPVANTNSLKDDTASSSPPPPPKSQPSQSQPSKSQPPKSPSQSQPPKSPSQSQPSKSSLSKSPLPEDNNQAETNDNDEDNSPSFSSSDEPLGDDEEASESGGEDSAFSERNQETEELIQETEAMLQRASGGKLDIEANSKKLKLEAAASRSNQYHFDWNLPPSKFTPKKIGLVAQLSATSSMPIIHQSMQKEAPEFSTETTLEDRWKGFSTTLPGFEKPSPSKGPSQRAAPSDSALTGAPQWDRGGRFPKPHPPFSSSSANSAPHARNNSGSANSASSAASGFHQPTSLHSAAPDFRGTSRDPRPDSRHDPRPDLRHELRSDSRHDSLFESSSRRSSSGGRTDGWSLRSSSNSSSSSRSYSSSSSSASGHLRGTNSSTAPPRPPWHGNEIGDNSSVLANIQDLGLDQYGRIAVAPSSKPPPTEAKERKSKSLDLLNFADAPDVLQSEQQSRQEFRNESAKWISAKLSRYYKEKKITSKDDFKYLCRKLTHQVIGEEEKKIGPSKFVITPKIETDVKNWVSRWIERKLKNGVYVRDPKTND